MPNLQITVEHLQRGQPCSYAPHTYQSRITIVGEQPWERLLENQVRDLVRAVVHPFTDEPVKGALTSQADYYKPRLTKLECEVDRELADDSRESTRPTTATMLPETTHRSVWFAEVQIPYCD